MGGIPGLPGSFEVIHNEEGAGVLMIGVGVLAGDGVNATGALVGPNGALVDIRAGAGVFGACGAEVSAGASVGVGVGWSSV